MLPGDEKQTQLYIAPVRELQEGKQQGAAVREEPTWWRYQLE